MTARLAQLRAKAAEFATKHGGAYYKEAMEKNKQYVVQPPTVEKCQELSKQLFYTRLASLPGRHEAFWKELDGVKQVWKNRKELKLEDLGIATLFGAVSCYPNPRARLGPNQKAPPRLIIFDRAGCGWVESAPAAMTSRKLLLRLTAARRSVSRAPALFSASPLLEAFTSTSHAAVATKPSGGSPWGLIFCSRALSSTCSAQHSAGDAPAPSTVDHKSILPEDEFHKLADETIHDLLDKLEEYGDSQQMDSFDIDYGNQVLTLRLGNLGTYVVNKQTPNRQIWLSSPVSGPSRFDWDATTNSWVYRRTGANLMQLLEKEVGELCGTPVELS